jgi:hypothetical protein
LRMLDGGSAPRLSAGMEDSSDSGSSVIHDKPRGEGGVMRLRGLAG